MHTPQTQHPLHHQNSLHGSNLIIVDGIDGESPSLKKTRLVREQEIRKVDTDAFAHRNRKLNVKLIEECNSKADISEHVKDLHNEYTNIMNFEYTWWMTVARFSPLWIPHLFSYRRLIFIMNQADPESIKISLTEDITMHLYMEMFFATITGAPILTLSTSTAEVRITCLPASSCMYVCVFAVFPITANCK
jgi:hypothetical protein